MVDSLLVSLFLHHFALPARAPVQSLDVPRGRDGGVLTMEVRQPEGRSFRPGSQRVPMLELQLTASCAEDVPVHSLDVQRRGLGSHLDILSVYAMEGFRRLNRGRQPQRHGTVQLTFRKFVIPACGRRSLTVMADFSSGAAVAGEHFLTIHSPADVDAGSASVRLTQRRVERRSQRAVGERQGTIDVSYPALTRRVRYGEDQVVARLRLKADSQDDHRIHAITFTNDGSARDDHLRNLFLVAGRNRRISNVAPTLSGDAVRLALNPPLLLKKNQTRLLTLHADVRASRSRTIKFLIEEPGDVEAEVVKGR